MQTGASKATISHNFTTQSLEQSNNEHMYTNSIFSPTRAFLRGHGVQDKEHWKEPDQAVNGLCLFLFNEWETE